ncbi:MAG: WbqC family protein, partial [Flavobacteriales bacterium]|nr:WbqC family protein [Flavobacteriales bacterium]
NYLKIYDNAIDYRDKMSSKQPFSLNFEKYIQVFSDRHEFIPNLSILDLLFNEGPNTINYLRRN